jgi:hypothetical protein
MIIRSTALATPVRRPRKHRKSGKRNRRTNGPLAPQPHQKQQKDINDKNISKPNEVAVLACSLLACGARPQGGWGPRNPLCAPGGAL